jgi:single-stranded DNA-binding protein
VVCWGQCAQNVGEHFLKGDLVVAVGVWQREQWIDHEGKPAQRTTLAARHVGLGVTFKAARYVKTIVEES